jgi:hypothetical protein
MPYHSSTEVFDESHGWRYRVLLAAFPHDPMGTIVRAVLGRNLNWGVSYGLAATIGRDGIVRTGKRVPRKPTAYNSAKFHVLPGMPIGSIAALRDEFRRLADHCKLNDKDREALFMELRKWCGKDERAISGLDVEAPRGVI